MTSAEDMELIEGDNTIEGDDTIEGDTDNDAGTAGGINPARGRDH